jgi:hypothetical protein
VALVVQQEDSGLNEKSLKDIHLEFSDRRKKLDKIG